MNQFDSMMNRYCRVALQAQAGAAERAATGTRPAPHRPTVGPAAPRTGVATDRHRRCEQ